jgi:choline kinase
MNAIILSAGKGTRLRPETISIPKGMVKLFDKSLLEMQIDIFKKCGINDISIVTGYLADKITFPSINYFKNENFSSTAGNESIFCAREKLQDCTIITYGDLVFEKAVIDQVIDFKGDIGIAVDLDWEKNYVNRDQHPKSEADTVLFDKEGNILELRKNIQKPDSKIGEFVGIVKLSKKGSNILSKKLNELHALINQGLGSEAEAFNIKQSAIPDMIQELIDSEINVEPIYVSGKWCEIDTPQDLEIARKIFEE